MDTNTFDVNIKRVTDSYIELNFYSKLNVSLTITSCNFIRVGKEKSQDCDRVNRVQRVMLNNSSSSGILAFPNENDNYGMSLENAEFKHVNVIVRDDTNKKQFSVCVPFSAKDLTALEMSEMDYNS